MLSISQTDIEARLLFDNPWWGTEAAAVPFRELPKREYLVPFYELATDRSVLRAIVLLGPRRVGKTVILHQTIHGLLESGIPGNRILFVPLETPVYTDIPLARFRLVRGGQMDRPTGQRFQATPARHRLRQGTRSPQKPAG